MNPQEKRRAPRSKHNSVLEIFDDSGRLIAGIGRLVDISSVGVCFSSTRALDKGQTIHGRLRLLSRGILEITGEIVWSRKKVNTHLYGLSFKTVRQILRKAA